MGWLTNEERRNRRDSPLTLTDNDVAALIDKVDFIEEYLSRKFRYLENLVRLRDKAMIAMNWIWFKRGGEVLRVKRRDIQMLSDGDGELLTTFSVSKKKHHYKICPSCNLRNGRRSNFCRGCNYDLRNTGILEEGGGRIVTKRKTLRNPFTKHILAWLEEHHRIFKGKPDDSLLFPALRIHFNVASWDLQKPMTIQNFDRILQRLDPRMTSCLFRYGGTEKYLTLGYTPYEMKEIGDWESTLMPEIYGKRKGLTPTQRRWSEDSR